VVKPDQLIKRRGKLGLIKAGVDLQGVQDWLAGKLNKDFQVSNRNLSLSNQSSATPTWQQERVTSHFCAVHHTFFFKIGVTGVYEDVGVVVRGGEILML
jgi:hypothetical protein